MVITYSESMDQPGKDFKAHPARGQLNRENGYFGLDGFRFFFKNRVRLPVLLVVS